MIFGLLAGKKGGHGIFMQCGEMAFILPASDVGLLRSSLRYFGKCLFEQG